jgi:hypothetical protein
VCVTGGYGLGTYFGKLLAWLLGRDTGSWATSVGSWEGSEDWAFTSES